MRYPEITLYNEFGNKILETVVINKIKSIIEIGSGSGNGSTQCFIEALKHNGDDVKLHCFEPHPVWYLDLIENTKNYSWIKCYNESAINYDDLLVKDYYNDFWISEFNEDKNLSVYELKKSWYDADLSFFKKDQNSILPSLDCDAVLIDGCEFSGYSEFKKLNSSIKWIFLDDCFGAFKCKQIYFELKNSKDWQLYAEGTERNGWAIFQKV